MIKLIKYSLFYLCPVLMLSSCDKFLEVKPQDNILEDQVFSSVNGFNIAINGIYAEMNNTETYGTNLTAGLVDVMAQYYLLGDREHVYAYYTGYDFNNVNFKDRIESIWSRMYTLIANTNAIIARVDEKQDMLGNPYYKLYKGESLAMRAFLHFDLLRLFGSTYAEDAAVKVMPYMTKPDRGIEPLLTASEVLQKINEDLKQAKELLKDSDPILTKGTLNVEDPLSNLLNYRQYRLNYFAVTGLLARVNLWMENKEEAKKYAKEVIDVGQAAGKEIFPFVTLEAVNNANLPDRVFSTEVLFALYNTRRVNIQNSLFSYSLTPQFILTFVGSLSEGRVPQLYPNENDYRRKLHWAQRVNNASNEVLYFTKYLEVTDNTGVANGYKNMFPLMRISEMYLIMMETATDLTEATHYYNILQVHRGLPEGNISSEAELQELIQNEYLKEFIGEGQTFFYFKRLRMTSIPSPIRPGIDKMPMDKTFYVLPLPDSEISQRN